MCNTLPTLTAKTLRALKLALYSAFPTGHRDERRCSPHRASSFFCFFSVTLRQFDFLSSNEILDKNNCKGWKCRCPCCTNFNALAPLAELGAFLGNGAGYVITCILIYKTWSQMILWTSSWSTSFVSCSEHSIKHNLLGSLCNCFLVQQIFKIFPQDDTRENFTLMALSQYNTPLQLQAPVHCKSFNLKLLQIIFGVFQLS